MENSGPCGPAVEGPEDAFEVRRISAGSTFGHGIVFEPWEGYELEVAWQVEGEMEAAEHVGHGVVSGPA